MSSEAPCHVFLVSFPGQGHINPTLRLAKKLAGKGLFVTVSSTLHVAGNLKKAGNFSDQPIPVGNGFISFEFFEDGCSEDDDPRRVGLDVYFPQLERFGRASLSEILKNKKKKNCEENLPVSCVVGNPFMPWVCDVAQEAGIPCAVLWVQSCAVFSIYYHYFHQLCSFSDSETQTQFDVKLPCLPVLKHDEIPNYLHPRTDYQAFSQTISGHFCNLSTPFCVLMDTFQELERDVIDYMSTICPIKPIGPLFKIPKSSDDRKNTVISADFIRPDECFEWLNSKPPRSVVYVSFGSVVHLKQEQVDEIAHGLCNSGFPFLWVLKPLPLNIINLGMKSHVLPDGLMERAGDRAKVVQWSPQEEVLSHPSVACFVTHCGWNSSVEALSSGVPVMVFPQWGDQVTNAKFLVDVFGVGLRLSRGVSENRVLSRDELKKCLQEAMVGHKEKEMRENALRWKRKAEEAAADGGSSEKHIQEFVDEIKKRSPNKTTT